MNDQRLDFAMRLIWAAYERLTSPRPTNPLQDEADVHDWLEDAKRFLDGGIK